MQEYKLPKHLLDREKDRVEANPDSQVIIGPGHAYKDKDLKNEHDINKGVDLWAPPSSSVQALPLMSGINEEKDAEFLHVKKTKRKRKEDHDESGKKKGKKEKKKAKMKSENRGNFSSFRNKSFIPNGKFFFAYSLTPMCSNSPSPPHSCPCFRFSVISYKNRHVGKGRNSPRRQR